MLCTEEGRVGSPACPSGQLCIQGACVACARIETCDDGIDNDCNGLLEDGCGPGGQGGEGGNGGEAGEGPAGGQAGKPGGAGGEGGSAGISGQGGNAGQSGAGAGGDGGSGGESGASGAGAAGVGGDSGSAGIGGVGGDSGSGGAAGSSGAAGDSGAGQSGAGQSGAGGGPPSPAKLGEACGGEIKCEGSLLCRPLSDWNKDGGSVCSKPCCDSFDCGKADGRVVCMPSKLGGGMCLGGDDAGRSGVGTKPQGESCGGSAECRSGWCSEDKCQDLCCTDSCASGTCGVRGGILGSSLKAFACGPAVGPGAPGVPGGSCGKAISGTVNHAQCASGVCGLFYPSQINNELYCSKACRTDSECTSLEKSLETFFCDYQEVNGAKVRVCIDANPEQPIPCATDGDCGGKKCLPHAASGNVLRCQ